MATSSAPVRQSSCAMARVHHTLADPPPGINLPRTSMRCPLHRSSVMSQGDKSSYTDKQKRQAEHIEKSERKEGKSKDSAERIAWATVNKQDGGGKKKS
jgi:hypothetical protein